MAVTFGKVVRTLGVGLYVIVTRSILTVAVVFTALFFVLNSSGFPDMLFGALKGVIPGRFEAGRIQISPVPWIVDVTDFAITTPTGKPIIQAGLVRVRVKLLPLFDSLLNLDQRKLRLEFSSVRLRDFKVLLEFDESGHLELVDAFDFPGRKPPSENPLRILLGIGHVSGTNGQAFLSFPEWDVRLDGIDMKTDFSLGTFPTRIRVEAEYFNYISGVAHLRLGSGAPDLPSEIHLRQGLIDGFVYNWDEISFRSFVAGFDFGTLKASDGYLSWAKNLKYALTAQLEVPESGGILSGLTSGLARGGISVSAQGSGDRSDPQFYVKIDSPSMKLGEVDLGVLHAEATGGRDADGVFKVSDIAVAAKSGVSSVNLSEGLFELSPPDSGLKWNATASLAFTRVNFAAILRTLKRTISPKAIPIPGGSTGEFKLGASASRAASMPGPVDTSSEFKLTAAGSMSGRISRKGVLEGKTYSLEVSGTASGRNLSRPVISLSELRLNCGVDIIRAAGTMDLERDRLYASATITKDLSALLKPFGVSMAGTAMLSAIRMSGKASSPSGTADVVLSGFEYRGWKVASASAQASLTAGLLEIDGFKAVTPFARIDVSEGEIYVPGLASRGLAGNVNMSGVKLAAIDIGRLPFDAPVEGTGFGSAGRLGFNIRDPLGTMSGDAVLHLDRIDAFKRGLELVTVKAAAERGNASMLSVDALVRGGGSVTVKGGWDFADNVLDLEGSLKNVPLKTLLALKEDAALSGTVSALVRAFGKLSDPELDATVSMPDFEYAQHRFSPVSVGASRQAGGDLHFSSDRFFRAMRFAPGSRVFWKDGMFSGMMLDIAIDDLTPQDVIPSIPLRKLSGRLNGHLFIEMPSFSDGAITGRLESPPGGLWVEFLNLQTRLKNQTALKASFSSTGHVVVSGVSLDDGMSTLSVCGENDQQGLRAFVSGSVGAHWLRALKGTFSTADGELAFVGRPGARLELPEGCDAQGAGREGVLLISGTLKNPVLDGVIRTGDVNLGIRGFGDPVSLARGGEIVLEPVRPPSGEPYTKIDIPAGRWISGTIGDGSFNLSGGASLHDGRLEDGSFKLNGSQIRYVSTGEFFVVADPRLDVTFDRLGLLPGAEVASEDAGIAVSGQVNVTDGSYHRDYNVMTKAFSGITGERAGTRSGLGLLKSVPWLADTKLDIALRAPSFGLRTSLGIGETDLDVGVNVNLRGTLKYPELWNRVEVIPGGTFTYNVVRREFEVYRGTVDFDGEIGHPELDIQARTYIEYSGFGGGMVAASRFSPDESNDAFYGDMIQVNLAVSGRYPDLDIEITSPSRGISTNDLQVLLLTGIAPGQSLTASSGSFVNVNLLTSGLTDSLFKIVLADMIDSVNVGVSASGDVNLDVSAHIGRRFKFQTQVQQGTGTSQYSTGFKIRLTEGLSLEGRLKAVEYSADQDDVGRNYDTRLRYRFPIE